MAEGTDAGEVARDCRRDGDISALGSCERDAHDALRALAAIAPVRKKRMVNLWQKGAEQTFADVECDGIFVKAGWQKMNRAGPIELEG